MMFVEIKVAQVRVINLQIKNVQNYYLDDVRFLQTH